MNTTPDIGDVLRHAGNCYPEFPLNIDVIEAYSMELAGFSDEQIKYAARDHIRAQKDFPRVSDLYGRLTGDNKKRSVDEFFRALPIITNTLGVANMVLLILVTAHPEATKMCINKLHEGLVTQAK